MDSPLMLATSVGQLSACKQLAKMRADVNAKNKACANLRNRALNWPWIIAVMTNTPSEQNVEFIRSWGLCTSLPLHHGIFHLSLHLVLSS